jgi:putative phosphoesterase
MKLLIASDIHGSAYYCRKLLAVYEAVKPDRMLLLGDILYHGPRNDLPRDYNPKKVIELLTPYSRKILCVRGNCEAEVDQMVLPFPVMADYAVLMLNSRTIYATHGHKYGPDNPPPLCPGDILLCGHTHIPADDDRDYYRYVNPGSVSIPKEGSHHAALLFDENGFTPVTLD